MSSKSRLLLLAAVSSLSLASSAWAQLPPPITPPATGSEQITCVQSGQPKTCTSAQIAALAVTSVAVSGGTTGLTTSGGPITGAGTITIAGTLAVANGGTGSTAATGSGTVVLATSPTLTTPNIGVATGTALTLSAQPGFMASFNSATDATFVPGSYVIFNTTGGNGYNTGSGYSTTTGLFTAPSTGWYLLHSGLYLTNSGSNTQGMTAAIYINGVQSGNGVDAYPVISGTPNNVGGTIELSMTSVLHLNAGDTVGLQPVATNLRIYQGRSWFGMQKLF